METMVDRVAICHEICLVIALPSRLLRTWQTNVCSTGCRAGPEGNSASSYQLLKPGIRLRSSCATRWASTLSRITCGCTNTISSVRFVELVEFERILPTTGTSTTLGIPLFFLISLPANEPAQRHRLTIVYNDRALYLLLGNCWR
jgi:hypothetical protein